MRSRSRWVSGIATACALAGLVAVVPLASAHQGGGDGPQHCMHQMGHHGPGQMDQRMERMIERVFTRVGASEQQKARAREIVKASSAEMASLSKGHDDGRQEMIALLSADTIDRDRLEQHRAAHHAQMEQMSKVMTRTLADLAEVLTPEQRREAAKMFAQMHEEGRHGRPGNRRPPRSEKPAG
ncbi:MAG TPA: Spy/CpxP family protein refolding chaperone [Methyloversatilis sp.]